MKKEDLKDARLECLSLIQKRDKVLKAKERLHELMKNEIVKEYIRLQNEVDMNYNGIRDEEIVRRVFFEKSNHIEPKDSNHIMVYQGTYILSGAQEEKELTYDFNPKGEYKVYKDLETGEEKYILVSCSEEFEEKNVTVYPRVTLKPGKLPRQSHYSSQYIQLKYWFFEQILKRDQQEVVEEIKARFVTHHEDTLRPKKVLEDISVHTETYKGARIVYQKKA